MTIRKELLDKLEFIGATPARPYNDPNGTPIRWIMTASFKPISNGPTLELGISENGTWVVPAAEGSVWDVESTSQYLPLFPLLEMTYSEARTVLDHEFRRHGIDPQWLTEFPFNRVAAAAFRSGSKFWPDGALEWVNHLPVSDDLLSGLVFLEEHGKTQRQRHQAARLLRQR